MNAPRALAAAQAQAEQAKRAADPDEQSGKRAIAQDAKVSAPEEGKTVFLDGVDPFMFQPAIVTPRVSRARVASELHARDQVRSAAITGVADAVSPALEKCIKFADRCKRNAVLFFKNPKWYVQTLVATGQISESSIATRLASFARYEENNGNNNNT
jgi:hypothetical protein